MSWASTCACFWAEGFGRYFIQTHRQELMAWAGVAVSREEFSDGQTQESIEGILRGIL